MVQGLLFDYLQGNNVFFQCQQDILFSIKIIVKKISSQLELVVSLLMHYLVSVYLMI